MSTPSGGQPPTLDNLHPLQINSSPWHLREFSFPTERTPRVLFTARHRVHTALDWASTRSSTAHIIFNFVASAFASRR